MGIPNDDEVKGAFDRAKGRVKEEVGEAVGNDRLADEGRVDQVGGQVQQGFGEARRKVGEAIDEVADRIKG